METSWRSCSSCKKPIGFLTTYYECNVSTCTGKRTGYVFCSVACFERHLPAARHRDAWAIEHKSPSQAAWHAEMQGTAPSEVRSESKPDFHSQMKPKLNDQDILIVVSKLKDYIKAKADMNTSGDVAEILSHLVRRHCDDAIHVARSEGRKTVMARDFRS